MQWASEDVIAALPGVGQSRARRFRQAAARDRTRLDGTADDLFFADTEQPADHPAAFGFESRPVCGHTGFGAPTGDTTVRIISAGQARDVVAHLRGRRAQGRCATPDFIVERVLTNRRRTRAARRSAPPLPVALLMPGAAAGEWELCRATGPLPLTRGSRKRASRGRCFATLEAAAANLLPDEPFVLALPVEMGMVQRLALPGGRAVRTGGNGAHPAGENFALPGGGRGDRDAGNFARRNRCRPRAWRRFTTTGCGALPAAGGARNTGRCGWCFHGVGAGARAAACPARGERGAFLTARRANSCWASARTGG